MKFPPVKVARDVCGDIPATIPVNIDCSLCGLGWPQQSGEIELKLYSGNDCAGSNSGILGDYSYWLNGAYLPGRFRFQCRNPGENAEPNPNEWIAGGEFSWGGTWRADTVLTVVNKTTARVDGSIRWLNPATMKLEVWTTFSATMTEDNPQGITDPRRHRVFKSGKIPISVNAAAGGAGDPVTHISIAVGTRPMLVGCGTVLCALWDGSHYHTCMRAEVTDTGKIPALSQMGKSQKPCGGKTDLGQFQPWCDCDTITLKQYGQSKCAVNSDPAFAMEYGMLGDPPIDVEQQVQVGGGLVLKRCGDNRTRIWTKNAAGQYIEGTWSVEREFGPTIWAASFGSPVFRTARLYSLAFPSPNILPDQCSISTLNVTNPTDYSFQPFKWYCVPHVYSGPVGHDTTPTGDCVQAQGQPAGALAGPWETVFDCAMLKCDPGIDWRAAVGTVVDDPIDLHTLAPPPPPPAPGDGPLIGNARFRLPCIHLGKPIEGLSGFT